MNNVQEVVSRARAHQRQSILQNVGLSGEPVKEQPIQKSEDNDLEKAFNPTDIFNHSSTDNVLFLKTGKEIKAKLELIKAREEGEKKHFAEEMAEYKAKAGCDPKGKSYLPWRAEKIEHLIGDIPKKYTWEQMYPKSNDMEERPIVAITSMNEKVEEVTTEKKEYMQEYNEYCHKFIDVSASIIQTETIIRNLKDGDTYKLKADQLTALGF